MESSYKFLDKSNKETYSTFKRELSDSLKTLPNKDTRSILMSLIDNDRLLIGLGTNTYDDFGNVFVKNNKIAGIAINSSKIFIDITSGKPSNANDCNMFIYYLYITHLVNSNIISLTLDNKFISNAVQYVSFLFFKVLKLSGYQDKQKQLIKELIELFFRKLLLGTSTKVAISSIDDKEVQEYFLQHFNTIDKYKRFMDIFAAFSQIGVIKEKTPNELIQMFASEIGIIPMSLLFRNINDFTASLILAQYDNKMFKPLLIDYKLQNNIEQIVQQLHKKQEFTK